MCAAGPGGQSTKRKRVIVAWRQFEGATTMPNKEMQLTRPAQIGASPSQLISRVLRTVEGRVARSGEAEVSW